MRPRAPTCSWTGSSASAAGPDCGPLRWPSSAGTPGVPVVAVDVPSGVSVDDGRLDGPHVVADVTVTFGTHKVAHLVQPAAGACGAVTLVDIGLDLPPAPVSALQPSDVAALVPVPAAGRAQVHPRRGRAPHRRRVPRRRAAVRGRCRDRAGRDGAVRRSRRGLRPAADRASGGSGRPRVGCRRGWSVRAGERAPVPTSRPLSTTGSQWSWTPTRSRTCRRGSRRPRCSPRTPGSWPGCSAWSARTWRPGSSSTCASRRRGSTPSACSRDGTRWSRTRADASR